MKKRVYMFYFLFNIFSEKQNNGLSYTRTTGSLQFSSSSIQFVWRETCSTFHYWAFGPLIRNCQNVSCYRASN